ncbi:MAG: iron ABC transporter permease [Spirochaetales bacterium]|nr:iron ABC transporter permease [Spirochaetales bacterium]
MLNSKSFLNKLQFRGAALLLGIILFIFYIYPPLLLFFKGGSGWSFSINRFTPLLNSLQIGLIVFILTSVIGGALAFAAVRLTPELRNMIDKGIIISFAIPPYILALAWVQIFGRNGYFERIVHLFFSNSNYHSNPYSILAAAVVMTLHLYPLMYMSIRNGIETIPVQYEQAAHSFGASSFRTFSGIVLPLILPNIVSTGLLVFSRTMANFSVPALLCLPVGIEFIPTGIYSALSRLDSSEAARLSIILVTVSTVLHLLHLLVLKQHNRDVCFNAEKRKVSSSKKSFAAKLLVLLFFIMACAIPLLAMIVSSFLLRWGLPVKLEYLTFNNYIQLFTGTNIASRAFLNSITYGLCAAIFAVIIGGSAAILAKNKKSISGRIIETAALWPMAIPNTVLAVAAIYAWNKPPLRIYGSVWCIIITYMVLFTPIVMKQITALLMTADQRSFDAARISGASRHKAFFTVNLPLLIPGIISGVTVCMMIALREIPISLMLYSSGNETVGVLLFGMQSQSYGLEMTSAIAVVLVFIILTGNKILRTLGGKKF